MILDDNDPSGLGVFSKAGRQLTEKIPILSRRKPAHLKRQFTQQSFTPMIDRRMTGQPGRSLIKIEPFEKSISREKRFQILQGKNTNPVVGQYHPVLKQKPKLVLDYLEVYRRVQANSQNIKIRRRKNIQNETTLNSEQYSAIEQASQKSVGHINMSKMLGRNYSYNKQPSSTFGVSDSQSIQNPEYSRCDTQYRPHLKGSITFTKQLSRDKANRKRTQPGIIYDCKYEFIKKSPGSVGAPFYKRVGRKSMLNKTYTMAAACYDYDGYVWRGDSNIYPKTRMGLIEFAKQMNRKKDDSGRQYD